MAELTMGGKVRGAGGSSKFAKRALAYGHPSENVDDRRDDPLDYQPTKGGRGGMGKRKSQVRKSNEEAATIRKEMKAYHANRERVEAARNIKPRKDIISDEAWQTTMSKKADGTPR